MERPGTQNRAVTTALLRSGDVPVPKTPSYRQRKGRDQAIVTLTDSLTKKRRDYGLGEFGSPESRERYHRVIAEWEAQGRRLPDPDFDRPAAAASSDPPLATGPSVNDVVRRFWWWAKDYYQPHQAGTYKIALHLMREYYGESPAVEFGPSKLRLLREEMIRGDASADPPRIPWSRRYINQQMQRIRQMFKWAASHEMLPSSIYETLATIEPLKRGRTKARENEAVGPVPQHLLDAVRPHLNRQVRALVELQLLTGARPGELLGVRAVDIEMHRDDAVWLYRPKKHKNAFREIDRTIYIGPQAQRIIEPFLADRPVDAFLFSPAEAEEERRAAAHAARKTPISYGNRPGDNRRANPKRYPGDLYTTAAYYRAVQYACDKAFPPAPPVGKMKNETRDQWRARLTPEQKADLAAWRRDHRWHPHQLRHNAGTQIRREFGLEAAQLALGHASAQITDAVYAERDHAKVIEVMRRVG